MDCRRRRFLFLTASAVAAPTFASIARAQTFPARPVRVIDSVGASFANLGEGGGWRRESWTAVGIPPSDDAVEKMISVSNLTKRR